MVGTPTKDGLAEVLTSAALRAKYRGTLTVYFIIVEAKAQFYSS